MGFAIDYSKKYTYADYLTWPDEESWELIDGVPYRLDEAPTDMSPAPKRVHQRVLLKLAVVLSNYLEDSGCQVYVAPFDVRLSEDLSDDYVVDNVVQPDISVFCDQSKLDDQGAKGAPDLVVEILSPSTASKDMKTKLLLYQKYGVKEYWLVDTDQLTIERLNLDDLGKYNPGRIFRMDETFESKIFRDLSIELQGVFEDPL